ncbi:MAG TPA: FAD-binding oxidoreductase [Nevskiaceae bacterium]|nr:FAD-binding oxidoreductase [Nevskiaceae bacterium]
MLAESEAEIASIIEAANRDGLKLVLSAGRTGLVEAQRPDGEAVLSLEKLNRILQIDASARLATVEAGVSIDALNAALEPAGLMFPLEMGSSSAATLGACVANGSAGANAVCYGTAANLCDAAWGFWGDGRAADVDVGEAWRAPSPKQLAINSAHFGNRLIGSQGVLGVITRVRVRLHPIPAQREAALIPVDTMPAAMDVLGAARAEFAGDVEEFEFISREAMELLRAAKGSAFRWPFERDPQARFYLLLQVKSGGEDDLTARLYDFLAKELALPEERIGYAPLKALKEIRHSISESSTLRMRARGGGRLAFDTAAPTAVFGDYLAALESAIRESHPHVELVAFGHAGVGGAHLHLLGDAKHPVDASARELVQLVLDVTQQFGGTFSAEHGVGTKWAEEFARRTPAAALREMVAAKRMRDPNNVLNPRAFGFDRLLEASP